MNRFAVGGLYIDKRLRSQFVLKMALDETEQKLGG
jgi:hypothetical protein